jgi:hypothetical protein
MNLSAEDHKRACTAADELEAECVRKIEQARRMNLRTAQVLLSAGEGEYHHTQFAAITQSFVIGRLKEKLNLDAKVELITDKNTMGDGSDVRVFHKHARWLEITL